MHVLYLRNGHAGSTPASPATRSNPLLEMICGRMVEGWTREDGSSHHGVGDGLFFSAGLWKTWGDPKSGLSEGSLAERGWGEPSVLGTSNAANLRD